MQKGESIKFLDYLIRNSLNNDGIVLSKPGGELWECHLGNFLKKEDAMQAAIIYFMIARPEQFHATLYYRAMKIGGQYHEYYLLKNVIEKEGLEMPSEITIGDGINCMVYFKGNKIEYHG